MWRQSGRDNQPEALGALNAVVPATCGFGGMVSSTTMHEKPGRATDGLVVPIPVQIVALLVIGFLHW